MSTAFIKIKVLIVDGHTLLRCGLAALLSEADDIEVVGSVSGGKEAIDLSPSIRPDLILMDIIMQGMTGIEATRSLKAHDNNVKVILISSEITKDIPIIMISAYPEGKKEARRIGVNEFLQKPFHSDDLLKSIERQVNRRL